MEREGVWFRVWLCAVREQRSLIFVRDGQSCDYVAGRGRGESMPLQHACVVGSRWVLRRCGEFTELGWVGSQVHLFGCMFRSACVRSRELRVSAMDGFGTGWGTARVARTRRVR